MKGEQFPQEYKMLVVVPDTGFEVMRCPICGQAYVYSHDYDNDIYNLMDYGVLYRIDENRVAEIIAYHKKLEEDRLKQIKKFWYKVRKKFGTLLNELPDNQRKIIEYLKDKKYGEEYIEKIASDFGFDRNTMQDIVNNLEKHNFIRKWIIYPLRVGEHNFQEEMTDVDSYTYTKISINV